MKSLTVPLTAPLIAYLLTIVIPSAARADDDVVADGAAAAGVAAAPAAAGKPADDDMQRWLDHQARHLVLGWEDGRLELDLVAMRAGALGPDFDRHHAAVQATLTKAPQLLTDAAVANGLPREVAEKLFADVGRRLAADKRPGDDSWIKRLLFDVPLAFGGGNAASFTPLLTPDLAAEPGGPVLYLALALKSATQRNILPPQGGMSGSNDAWELEYGDLKLNVSAENQPLAYEVSRAREPRRSFALADAEGPALSITWEADGTDDESLRIRQTADGFRATLVRDGESAMKLEGATFRDCCLAHPDVVRRTLIPLLRSIGIGTPAMPDDDAVKAAVVARLRRAAGLQPAAEAKQGLTPAELEAAKHRLTQATATIEAFRLLDDAAYLTALEKTATGDDAAAIAARLTAIGKR